MVSCGQILNVGEPVTLLDTTVYWIDGDAMCVAGFERERILPREYWRSLLVREITDEQLTTTGCRRCGPQGSSIYKPSASGSAFTIPSAAPAGM